MAHRILFAIADEKLAAHTRALLDEVEDLEVVQTVEGGGEIMAALAGREIDAVLIDEALGPLPITDLAREITVRHPDLGVVIVVSSAGPDAYRAALEAGARGLLALPLSLEELHAGLVAAAVWSQAVRARLVGEEEGVAGAAGGGTMLTISGAKGGVGTTTVAVHLALASAAGLTQRVCLVDLDLQAGDVPSLLDLSHRRSVSDLVGVAHEMTPRHLNESLYRHESGLRVLLAPSCGEEAEAVNAIATRQILTALRSRFDLVVVDCGTVVTEAGAVAVEMAERSLVVVTPDVPALLAARRLIGLWERLQVRKLDDVEVVVNRASRGSEVQPDLAAKIVGTRVLTSVVPAAFRDLEAGVNARSPERLPDGALGKGLAGLAHELGLAPARQTRRRRFGRGTGQSGQIAVELVGLCGLILVIGLALLQMALAGYTLVLAGHAAREGARQLAVAGEVAPAATDALSGPWRDRAEVRVRGDVVEVSLVVPAVVPGLPRPWRLEVDAGTVAERP